MRSRNSSHAIGYINKAISTDTVNVQLIHYVKYKSCETFNRLSVIV